MYPKGIKKKGFEIMPLMKFDMLKGRTPEQIGALLDIVYEVQLETLGTPVGDRYQIVNQHEPYEIHILDTGLGVERSDQVVVITVITRPRTTAQKEAFYRRVVDRLHDELGMRKEDVMVSMVQNTDEDWSFFGGDAQFLTGAL